MTVKRFFQYIEEGVAALANAHNSRLQASDLPRGGQFSG
jgi:hypothetical protein